MSEDFRLDIPSSGICLVSLSNNSDMQNSLYSMFSALTEHGYEVWTVGAENPVCSNARQSERNLYVKCPDRPGVARGTFDLPAVEHVADVIRSTGCKTVYFESVHLWNCYVLARLGKDYTRVTTLHDVVPHDGSKSVLLCQKLQSRLSDYVVVKSEEFVEDAVHLYGVPHKQVITIGVWREWPAYEAEAGDGSFLFFGRLRRYKGLVNMLSIAKACPSQRFFVMGEPDKESAPLVRELGEMPNVEVVARHVSDVEMEAAFRRSSWVVLPYESATQSGVIIDSYKYGRPVIAFKVGAVDKQVLDGETGFLIRSGEVNAFADAVIRANRIDGSEYESFSKRAYEFGYRQYSAESATQKITNVFNINR